MNAHTLVADEAPAAMTGPLVLAGSGTCSQRRALLRNQAVGAAPASNTHVSILPTGASAVMSPSPGACTSRTISQRVAAAGACAAAAGAHPAAVTASAAAAPAAASPVTGRRHLARDVRRLMG